MSHPIHEAPPVHRLMGSVRWHVHTIGADPARYDDRDLIALAGIGDELSAAARAELSKRGLS